MRYPSSNATSNVGHRPLRSTSPPTTLPTSPQYENQSQQQARRDAEPKDHRESRRLDTLAFTTHRYTEERRRYCLVLDTCIPNQALTRRPPTVDEILQKMKGATVFKEVDLSQGYLQVTIAEESRYITAFQTPDDGPHRFTRLIMGAWPSRKYFHEVISQIIRRVPNCENISDNIWLWSQDMAEHIKQLYHLLETFQGNGITLKLPKCSFGVPEISAFSHIVPGQGIRSDNKKIEAIANAPQPKCTSGVRSLLGLTNYCSRYVPDYSSITYPLRQLIRTNSTFQWGKEQEQSFQRLNQALASPQVLAHYSLTTPTRLVVDASPMGTCSGVTTATNRFIILTNCLRFSIAHRIGNEIWPDRERITSHCIWL